MDAAASQSNATDPTPSVEAPSIAVLPFAKMSGGSRKNRNGSHIVKNNSSYVLGLPA